MREEESQQNHLNPWIQPYLKFLNFWTFRLHLQILFLLWEKEIRLQLLAIKKSFYIVNFTILLLKCVLPVPTAHIILEIILLKFLHWPPRCVTPPLKSLSPTPNICIYFEELLKVLAAHSPTCGHYQGRISRKASKKRTAGKVPVQITTASWHLDFSPVNTWADNPAIWPIKSMR